MWVVEFEGEKAVIQFHKPTVNPEPLVRLTESFHCGAENYVLVMVNW